MDIAIDKLAVVGLECPADINHGGIVSFFDVLAFLAAYSAGCLQPSGRLSL